MLIKYFQVPKMASKLNYDAFINNFGVVTMLTLVTYCTIFPVHSMVGASVSDSLQKELILSQKEKNAFDKLKSSMYSKLTWDIMKSDLFFLRWIRAKDLDVDRAERDMFMFLDFIKLNQIQTISQEDWSDLEEDYPFYTNITDRQGRPVGYGNIGGNWNIRRGMMQGLQKRMMRYSYKMVFEACEKMIEINRKQPNITQFDIVMNLDGFNPYHHSCAACISTYLTLLDTYERFLPGFSNEIIVINAPNAYLILLQVLRPLQSKHTRKALKVFGPNRNKWKPYLDARIDTNLLSHILD